MCGICDKNDETVIEEANDFYVTLEESDEKELPYSKSSINTYMKETYLRATESKAIRRKVGAKILKEDRPISDGYNGTHKGLDNTCEEPVLDDDGNPTYYEDGEQVLRTKETVLHAEANAIMKLAKSTETSEGSILFVTTAPCVHCSKLIGQAGISMVFFDTLYRGFEGLIHLKDIGVPVIKTNVGDTVNKTESR